MRYFIILSCIAFAAASPTRDARNAEVTKIETDDLPGNSKVEVSLEKTRDGLPKIVVDITDKRDGSKDEVIAEDSKIEEKDDLKAAESREVGDINEEEKGESRSTIHVHTPSSPQISLVPKYPPQSRPGYGLEGQMQVQVYDAKKKEKKEDKPYNQVNVYVYFPKDMMMMMQEESQMSVNSYNYDDGTSSSTMITNSQRLQQKKPEPCPIGFARINGVCLEVDRQKRVL